VQDYARRAEPALPDLITQRLIKAAIAKNKTPRGGELNGLARHCTDQEDNANRSSGWSARPPRRSFWSTGSESSSTGS
jgi:hypothetical protein